MLLEELRLLSQDVAQQQVGQSARAQAEVEVGEPFLTQHFADDGVVGEGILHGVQASGGLESHAASRQLVILLDGLAHHVGGFRRGGGLLLARAGLDTWPGWTPS